MTVRITSCIRVTLAGACLTLVGAHGAGPASTTKQKKWTDTFTLKGDLRYRYESIQDESKKDAAGNTVERQRDRIRARLGVESKITDTLRGVIQLSTGEKDPISGNQTLGDAFSKKDMMLNLAYFRWTALDQDPQLVTLIGGKMANPFLCVSDLVWDPDLTPEGLAAKAQAELGPLTVYGNGAYWWVQERSKEQDDTRMFGAQVALQVKPIDEITATLGASYYGFDEIAGYPVLDWQDTNNSYGNSTQNEIAGTTTNKVYAYDYAPVELFAKLIVFLKRLPLTLYGQTVSNDEAPQKNTGFLVGVTLGRAKNPKTFAFDYRYGELEKDAVLGALTDSDRWGGGTDGRGHRVHAKYQFTKAFQAGLTFFSNERRISDPSKKADYERLMVDLVYTF